MEPAIDEVDPPTLVIVANQEEKSTITQSLMVTIKWWGVHLTYSWTSSGATFLVSSVAELSYLGLLGGATCQSET